MQLATQKAFLAFSVQIAMLNGIDGVDKKFNVTPQVAEAMEEVIKESSEFLKSINITSVVNQQGLKIGLGANTPIASRTDTQANNSEGRKTKDPTGTDASSYNCRKTDYDTHLTYAKLDSWRHKKEFQILYRNVISKQIGRDRMMIGWNGTSNAANTDIVTNPLLQDVNIGWLEKIRLEAPTHHKATQQIGASVATKNLDAAVYLANREMTEEWTHTDTNKVVIVGSALYTDKFGSLINDHAEPTEKLATDVLIASQRIGGLRAIQVPFFPANAFLITSLDNLSIYVQEGTQRRLILDNPKFDRVEDYMSLNEDFIVENYDNVAFVEGITNVA